MRKRRTTITDNWISHRREMRESPAWRALPDNARRVLDRIELEHLRHGGADNGALVCTYGDLEDAGLRRASIARAIRECEMLGFLETKRQGYRTARSLRPPNTFRLTYVNGAGKSPAPTDEWRKVENDVQGWSLVREAAGVATKRTKKPREAARMEAA